MEKRCRSKKCNRILPENYKHRYCENCRAKQADTAKKAGGIVLGIVVTVITAGKIKPGNKA